MRRAALMIGVMTFGTLVWGASACAEVTAFGLSYTPLGQATLSADPTGLTVGNLGSSGQDGVSIGLSGIQNPSQSFFSLDTYLTPSGTPTTGSYFQSTVFGSFGGGPNEEISALTVTQLASGYTQVNAAFPPAAGQPVVINYYTGGPGGTLIYSENSGTGGGVPSIVIRWPIQSSPFTGFVDYQGFPSSFPDSIGVDLQYLTSVVTAGGTVLNNVDFVDFTDTSNLGSAQYSADDISVGGGGITSFAITNEAVTVPEPASLALVGMAAASLFASARRKYRAS